MHGHPSRFAPNGSAADEFSKLFCSNRPADVVTLDHITTGFAKELKLLGRFDAFGKTPDSVVAVIGESFTKTIILLDCLNADLNPLCEVMICPFREELEDRKQAK